MKVCVAGCSYSDYLPNNQVVYGQLLAEKLGAEYIHEGAGAGSNFRIWRRVVELIMDGTLTPNDLVVIQYTGLERREFWSSTPSKPPTGPDWRINTREPFDGGAIVRYKTWAHTWNNLIPTDYKLFKHYEEHHSSPAYSRRLFDVNHWQFQCTLKLMHIPTVFLLTQHTADGYLDLMSPHKERAYRPDLDWINDPNNRYEASDLAHLNDQAHEQLADQLVKHVGSFWTGT